MLRTVLVLFFSMFFSTSAISAPPVNVGNPHVLKQLEDLKLQVSDIGVQMEKALIGGATFGGSCEGMPPFTVGVDVGVFMSCNADRRVWRIVVLGDNLLKSNGMDGRFLFYRGSVQAKTVSLAGDNLNPNGVDRVYFHSGLNKEIARFVARVSNDYDAFELAVDGGAVMFAFSAYVAYGPGSYTLTPADIHIGANGDHPDSVVFRVDIP